MRRTDHSDEVITIAELQARKGDCWVALNGVVYDLSQFASQHPGGKRVVEDLAGKDATREFSAVHSPGVLALFDLDGARVGVLEASAPVSSTCNDLTQQPRLPLDSPFPHQRWENGAAEAGRFICCDGPLFQNNKPSSLTDDDQLFKQRSVLARADLSQWLHIGDPETYAREMSVRRRLLLSVADQVHRMHAAALPAATETLQMVLTWLARYAPPGRFEVSNGSVRTLTVGYQHHFNLSEYRERPLLLVALLIQDDVFVMQRGGNGAHAKEFVLTAGGACHSFDIVAKHGQSMRAIHHPHVPGFDTQLQHPIHRLFSALEGDDGERLGIIWRHNWQITAYSELVHHDLPFAPSVISNIHPSPPFSEDIDAESVQNLHWRVEYQCLQKLRSSRAILFTVRTYVDRMGGWAEQRLHHVAFAAAAAIRRKHKGMLHYMGATQTRTIQSLLEYLDSCSLSPTMEPRRGGECGVEPWQRSTVRDGTWAFDAEQHGGQRTKHVTPGAHLSRL